MIILFKQQPALLRVAQDPKIAKMISVVYNEAETGGQNASIHD